MSGNNPLQRPPSAPARLEGNPDSPPPPMPPAPPAPLRTIDNQGTPDPSLGSADDDIVNATAYRSITALVNALLNPPNNALNPRDPAGYYCNDRVTIRMVWVKQTVSEKHFIFDPAQSRSVLRNDSKIRTHGLAYGLPRPYWECLCGYPIVTPPWIVTKDTFQMASNNFRQVTLADPAYGVAGPAYGVAGPAYGPGA